MDACSTLTFDPLQEAVAVRVGRSGSNPRSTPSRCGGESTGPNCCCRSIAAISTRTRPRCRPRATPIVNDALSPHGYLPGLRKGQRWTDGGVRSPPSAQQPQGNPPCQRWSAQNAAGPGTDGSWTPGWSSTGPIPARPWAARATHAAGSGSRQRRDGPQAASDRAPLDSDVCSDLGRGGRPGWRRRLATIGSIMG